MTPAAPALLADTQVLIWYVLEPSRLSRAARVALDGAVANQEPVCVSAWSLVEIGYAVEKPSNPLTEEDREAILDVLSDPESPFDIVPVDASIAARTHHVPRLTNADPGDRVIVATAEVLSLSLVSSDAKLPSMTKNAVVWS